MPPTQRGFAILIVLTATACRPGGEAQDDGDSSSSAPETGAVEPTTDESASNDDANTPTSSSSASTDATTSAATGSDDATTEPASTSDGADEETTTDPNAPGVCAAACDGDPSVCCGMFGCDPQYPNENFDCVDGVCEFVGCESDEQCLIEGTFQLECHPLGGAGQCGGACEAEGEPCIVLSNAGTCIADDEGGVFCRNDAFACTSDEDCQYSGGHCNLDDGTCFCLDDGECSTGICAK